MVERKVDARFFFGGGGWRSGGKRPLGDPGMDGSIILRLIFWKWDVRVWTILSWLRIETSGGHLRMRN
jgi:hypothetical protein